MLGLVVAMIPEPVLDCSLLLVICQQKGSYVVTTSLLAASAAAAAAAHAHGKYELNFSASENENS